MKSWVALLMLATFGALAPTALGHEVRPAYLELRQTAPDTYDVLWKVPARGDRRLGIYVRFPGDARNLSKPEGTFSGDAYLERWRIQRAGGLENQTIQIDGLAGTKIDVLVRMENADGVTQTTRLLPASPSFTVEAAPSPWRVSATYLVLGIEHILLGIDHLLFVLALVLLVKGWKRLVGTITAFTVAHSITLAAATLGFVHVPGPPVEACIALSIVFVAAEIIRGRQGQPGLTERAPWVIAFTLRSAARTGLRRRVEQSWTAGTSHPAGTALFQHRRGNRTTCLHCPCPRSRNRHASLVGSRPGLGLACGAVRHRLSRDVLDDPTNGSVLIRMRGKFYQHRAPNDSR